MMNRRSFACLLLAIFCFGCISQADSPVTWTQDEDEITFYIYLTDGASVELINRMDEPLTFEEASDFLVQNTNGKIPFIEGAMAASALVSRREELITEMKQKRSQDGLTLKIIGFKENPIRIMKGALKFPKPPKYLVDFDPDKNPEIVKTMLNLLAGDVFVVEVSGRFPE